MYNHFYWNRKPQEREREGERIEYLIYRTESVKQKISLMSANQLLFIINETKSNGCDEIISILLAVY